MIQRATLHRLEAAGDEAINALVDHATSAVAVMHVQVGLRATDDQSRATAILWLATAADRLSGAGHEGSDEWRTFMDALMKRVDPRMVPKRGMN